MLPILHTLIAMDSPQPYNSNLLKFNIKSEVGIVHYFMKPKNSKPWDMRYHCLEDSTQMVHLNPYWEQLIYN